MSKRLLVLLLAALAFTPSALAKSGPLAFDGGTRAERGQVKAALDASSFDFGGLPAVTVHIARGVDSHSLPGQVWLDADLVDAGRFGWGVTQHEFGHQVDYFLLDDAGRTALEAALGGDAWCSGVPHASRTCERFADLVAWAYWTSGDNVMRPLSASDEGAQLGPVAFRATLARLLPAGISAPAPPRKG